MEQPRVQWIMHVGTFYAAFLKARDINIYPTYDTALAHYATDERSYVHGLKELARIRLGAEDWEKDIKRFLPSPKKSSYALIPKQNLYHYGSFDGVFTSRLKIDIPRLLEVDKVIEARMEELREIMRNEAKGLSFNPGSPLQCAKVIYDTLKLKPIYQETSTRKMKLGAAAKGLADRSTANDRLLELPQVPFVTALA